jgi:hypothetical protein
MIGTWRGYFRTEWFGNRSAAHVVPQPVLFAVAHCCWLVVSSSHAIILSASLATLCCVPGGANANPLLCDLPPKNSWSTAVG